MAVVAKLPVGLVGDQQDLRAKGLFCLGKHPGDSLQRLLPVDHPGGVVGAIDDHRLGPLRKLFLQLGKVRQEGFRLCPHLPEDAAVIPDVSAVLHEIRGKDDHLVVGIQDGLQQDIEAAGSPHGHDQILAGKGRSIAAVQVFRKALPHLRKAGVWHIAVEHHRVLRGKEPHDGVLHRLRRGNAGVSQGKIKDLVRPVFPLHPKALLEHGPDGGIVFHEGPHPFADEARSLTVVVPQDVFVGHIDVFQLHVCSGPGVPGPFPWRFMRNISWLPGTCPGHNCPARSCKAGYRYAPHGPSCRIPGRPGR